MSEKRFVKDHSYLVNYDKYCILDKVQHKHLYLDEVCEKLNEQQATIRRLQNLCGQSDGENAKLRIENKELKEEMVRLHKMSIELLDRVIPNLRRENEQLRKELKEIKENPINYF